MMGTKVSEAKNQKPAWSVRLDKMMTARGVDNPDLLKIMIANGFRPPVDRLAFENVLSTWRRGRVAKPRDDNALEHIARALGTTYPELMLGSDRIDGGAATNIVRHERGKLIMPDGEKIEADRLEPTQARVLAAAMTGKKAEVWRLTSDLLAGLSYQPGDFLIVDLAARPRPRDIVLAESSRVPVFRMYAPPYLFCLPLSGHVDHIVIDGVQTTIRGVVSSKLTI